MDLNSKQRLFQRWGSLKQERASWMLHWSELSTYISPRQGRFFVQDRNRGARRHNAIYDSTATRANKTLGAGMMSGATSPARPWFRLGTADPDLMDSANVKRWTADVTRLILDVFARSNTYRSLHQIYEELGQFGTGATIVMDDYDTVLHHMALTCGEYAIATDYRGNVNTLGREYEKTVAELVLEFGYKNCSNTVRGMYDRHQYDQWVPIIHLIEPRLDRDTTSLSARNKAFKSVYFELGGDKELMLRDSGFDEFPALVPRWATSGGDIYGNSPGMEALGDIKQLQHEQLRKAEGIDYMTKPPLQAPTSMKNHQVAMLPGGVTLVDSNGPNTGIRSAFDVNLRLDYLLADIQDIRERINSAFYADMFLMLASSNNTNMTATEVAERHEEKLLMLGPTLERLHNELLSPLVDITFRKLLKAGALPPPPEELQGQEINVEFVSILAQAQRAVATNGVDRFVGNLGAIAAFKPEVLDKFDSDQWADKYSDMLGVDPELIIPNDQVALIRQQRAQAQAQAQQAAVMAEQAKAASALGGTPTQGGSSTALDDVMAGLTGYTTPAAGLQ